MLFCIQIINNMISKSKIKLIGSLEHKRFRNETGLFLAEGPKLVADLMQSFKPQYIAATQSWAENNRNLFHAPETDIVTQDELERASLLRTPQQVLALFHIPDYKLDTDIANHNLVLVLDGVQDPGNVGTIIRIADWFGIKDIVCSQQTADAYAPKTVQATMGALARVHMHYCDLNDFFAELDKTTPVYGTLLDGENIYSTPLQNNGIIVMGNEGNGISQQIRSYVNQSLLIPSFPVGETTSESLNVAIATAIVCSEFRRRTH